MAKEREAPLTCYMCERPATSKEHAPPKCFFPKEADQPPEIRKYLGKNLISVPSCDVHNSRKSASDEYLRFVICSSLGGNKYQQHHWDNKVLASFKKHRGKFSKFAPDQTEVLLEATDGSREESLAIRVNQAEFEEAIDHIGRAVYFHHFGKKAAKYSVVHTAAFLDITSENREEVNEIHRGVQDKVDRGFEGKKKYGDNPEIFYYQVITDNEDKPIFSFTFYEGLKVTVAFSPEQLKSNREKKSVHRRRNPLLAGAVRGAMKEILLPSEKNS